jgi:hypothetical protein
MKTPLQLLIILLVLAGPSTALSYERPVFPFAAAAGEDGTTAVPVGNPSITSWATAVASINYGAEVAEEWRVPENAVGPGGGSQSHLLVLGRGGEVVLEFDALIHNGPGDDFVVFENAFRDTFLELAYVEVSSDGEQFVRFPAYSLTAAPVPAFGEVFPTFVHGLAGKYRTGYGTPFDLDTLRQAYAAAKAGEGGFSEAYREHLLRHFSGLDLSAIRYVRLVDIVGDGSDFDCEGFPIYDPYPTVITAGFDLDAVGVINAAGQQTVSFADWCGIKSVPAIWDEDTDHDKWSNSMEYLLGTDPASNASRPVLQTRVLPEMDDVLVAFDLNPVSEGRPVAEFSADGVIWQEVEIRRLSELIQNPLPEVSGTWGIRVRPTGQLFLFRLKAAQ